MVMTKDTPKKTAKENSFSKPKALRKGRASPAFPGGGVCGSSKLKIPSMHENIAPRRNGSLDMGCPAGVGVYASRIPMIQLATIQPTVPRTRKPGKSRPPSGTCVKAIELERAK